MRGFGGLQSFYYLQLLLAGDTETGRKTRTASNPRTVTNNNIFMKTLTFLAAFLITFSSSFSQKVEIKGFVFDKETGKPIKSAGILSFSHEIASTDENGYFHFSTKQKIDTLYINHIKYKNEKIAVTVSDTLTVYLKVFRYHLGSLKLSDIDYLKEADCNSNESKSQNDNSSLAHDHARYNGGMLCFDKYILNGLTENNLIEHVKNAKKVSILFEVNETGQVMNVNVKSKLSSEKAKLIEQLFLDSSDWKPAWQLEEKVSTSFKYIIRI